MHNLDIEDKNLWDGIFAAVMYATQATYHTILKATPMQLVFGGDDILNTRFNDD